MIHFNRQTRTFNLNLDRSFYALQVDDKNRVVHLGWGSRSGDSSSATQLITGKQKYHDYVSPFSFVTQFRPDELLTFGEVVTYQETLKVIFPSLNQALAAGEANHLPLRDLRLRYDGYEISTSAQPGLAATHDQPTRNTSSRETLRLFLRDPVHPFAVTLNYRVTPEFDIIERWLELENQGSEAVVVEVCNFASLHIPVGFNELTSVSGAWAREFQTQRERLLPGIRLLESRALQTGHMANPFFLLNKRGQAWEESGTVYFGQMAYSGSWRMSFERLPSQQLRVHAGYNPFDFHLTLNPGERHMTPALATGVCADGWGGASRRMHAFARERVLPQRASSTPYRPVLYNSWEAVTFDIDHDNQIELARKAAEIGVELFCLDDGWFGGRSSEATGLGDWFVRGDAFPAGLETLVSEVHRLGMEFGLWVEPEMVNPDSELYRRHPDWVLHFPGRPRTEARHQLILDFGRSEVVEYIYDVLNTLIARYYVAFLKWDMNRYTAEAGSVAGREIWYKHTAGVYHIMDRLRRTHPALTIQTCSGGGGRVDLGIFGRAEQAWVSDNTNSLSRLSIQEGFSLAYPACIMEAWVTDESNDLSRYTAPLAMRFDVAMRGVLGVGSNLDRLSAAELAEYARYITFYKQIRPIVQQGSLYRLQRLEEDGCSEIQYVLPDGREAVYSLVLPEIPVGTFRRLVPLRALHADAVYAISDQYDKECYRLSGYELMTLGVPPEENEMAGYSRTLYLRQV
ncbi:MAG: alpha-galactosidase [Candidatus Promineifilaceae bacterium]|nr:alpha-galactosidase [Candidatus Promineifilaceae bacterium]